MNQPSLLPAVWNVPEIFRKRLGQRVGRQRVMIADGHLLLILHAPPGPEDLERTGRFFWRQPDGTWSSDCLGGGTNAITRHLDEYQQLIETLEQADLEASGTQEYFDVIYRLDPIHRATRNLQNVLQEAREAIPEDRDIINFRDRAYQLDRTAELLERDARNGMELAIARQAEAQATHSFQMATSAHRLNVLAAFFFPIVTLCTIFGANLKHGLEEKPGPIPLLAVLGLGLLMGFLLIGYVTATPKEEGDGKTTTRS